MLQPGAFPSLGRPLPSLLLPFGALLGMHRRLPFLLILCRRRTVVLGCCVMGCAESHNLWRRRLIGERQSSHVEQM